uniref:Uncharacterized protein n=1 Tax=Auricularia cornea TaxID=1238391 RepID=A0A650G173_9AGAM|nr:hypothetical protein [Auricularia cornea]
MSTSETPLCAYRQTVSHIYSRYSAYDFVSDKVFRLAYYAFCRLQTLSGSYVCSSCGLWPEVILMDGVSAGYGNEFITSTIRPPTTVSADSPTRTDVRPPRNPTSVVQGRELRKRAQEEVRRLLDRDQSSGAKGDKAGVETDTDVDDDDVSLTRKKPKKKPKTRRRTSVKVRQGPRPDVELLAKQLGEQNAALGILFGAHVVGQPALRVEDEGRYLELLEQLLAYESVLQFAPSSSWPYLVLVSKTGDAEALDALLPLVPALALVGQLEMRVFGKLSTPFRDVVGFVLDRAVTVLSELPKHDPRDCDFPEPLEEDWRETGCFYGRPRVRNRPRYPDMENDGRQERGKVTTEGTNIGCSKFYEEYGKKGLTGGLMALFDLGDIRVKAGRPVVTNPTAVTLNVSAADIEGQSWSYASQGCAPAGRTWLSTFAYHTAPTGPSTVAHRVYLPVDGTGRHKHIRCKRSINRHTFFTALRSRRAAP